MYLVILAHSSLMRVLMLNWEVFVACSNMYHMVYGVQKARNRQNELFFFHCSIHMNLSAPPLFYKLVEEWGHFFLLEATSSNTMTWAGCLVQIILLTSSTDSCELVVISALQNSIQIFSSKNILIVDPWLKHFLAIFYVIFMDSLYIYTWHPSVFI